MPRTASAVFAGSLILAAGPLGARADDLVVNASLVGCWDEFDGSYADVWGHGDVAYLAHFGSASVDILDISDPAEPVLLVEYALPPPNENASAQDVKVGDDLLFISLEGSGNSVHIVDVREPAAPAPVVDIAIPGMLEIHNTFYHQGFLYIADSGTPRLAVVDLRALDPDDPPAQISEPTWLVEDIGTSIVHDVTVVGDRAYVAAWDSGIHVYDVSGVAHAPPAFLGSGPGNNTHSSWPTEGGAFVVTGEERSGGGIKAYRIVTSPDGSSVSLTLTDEATLPPGEASSVHNQAAVGDRVYNSWYGAGLRVHDLDPATGRLALHASYDTSTSGSAWGVYPYLGPDRVLVSSISAGLLVIDVATEPGDLNGDGAVRFDDLLALLGAWGPCADPPAPCPGDVNGDGEVGFEDLIELLAHWTG